VIDDDDRDHHLCSQRDDNDSGHYGISTVQLALRWRLSPASTTITTTAPFCQLVDVDDGQHHHCNQWHINYDDDYHDPPTWLPCAAKALMTAPTMTTMIHSRLV